MIIQKWPVSMTNQPQLAAPRRRFRFGLRTLLVVVTLAAVASWGYWIGWPWWADYRLRVRIEGAVRQLKIGSTIDEASAILDYDEAGSWQNYHNSINFAWIRYHSLNYEYFVYFVFQDKPFEVASSARPCRSVEAFRCARMPPDYTPRTQRVRDDTSTQAQLNRFGFNNDFVEFAASGQRESAQYELIYSDPPAKPVGK
jgi:hypothetical protein